MPFAMTLPVALTTATSGLLLSHMIFLLSVVSTGAIVALSAFWLPIFIVRSVSLNVIDVIGFNSSLTVTVHVAVSPADVLAVITVVPAPFAVMTPFSTTATSGCEDVHVNESLLAIA